jgi:enoyl-CoA hydratase/carnithine racemase
MTTAADFKELAALDPDEVVTHSYVRDIPLSSGKTLALITLDNGRDHTRPSTLGPTTLLEFAEVLDAQKARAARKEIHAVAITGKQYIFAAGADLSKVSEIPSRAIGKQMGEIGHWAFSKERELGVPSFVF